MISRDDILSKAVDDCMKELYSYVQPSVSWDDFIEQNRVYSKLYKEWENFRYNSKNESDYIEKLGWDKHKSRIECIGPAPYEFYYLPKDIMEDICNSYIYAYRIDKQQELLDTIEILKNYCMKPIINKYIEGENGNPGYRGYEHPDNLQKELTEMFNPLEDCDGIEMAVKAQDKFFEFLDMAGNFFNYNGELHTFNTSIYLGASPNSNKEKVIENWKKYKNQDIKIDEEQIKKEYYGEDFDE